MKKMFCFAMGMIVSVSAFAAVDKKPFTIDDLYRLKNVSGLALSPAKDRLCSRFPQAI